MNEHPPAARSLLRSVLLSPAFGAALLALVLFCVTLGGTYVYDDFDVFALDRRLRQPDQWCRYWTESYNDGVDNLYRPLVSMSYAIQWWVHGADQQIDQNDAWKYHLVNLLLHAAVSALVAELAQRLAGARVAWTVGLLFACHPIHVEPVANIVGRAELMCALGVVGAMVLFMKPMTIARAFAITGCFILALGSKEQGMLTPLLLLLLHYAKRGQEPFFKSDFPQDRVKTFAPHSVLAVMLIWILAAYIVFRESILKFWWDRSFLDWTINPLVHPQADRWLMPLPLLGRYFALLVAPLKLSPDYGATVVGWKVRSGDPYLWLGIIAILLWIVWFIVAWRRRDRVASFCLLSLAITYGLISNFVLLIGTNFAERLMYLPSVFFLILVAGLLGRLPREAMITVVAVAAMLFSIRSFTYARSWNERISFYQRSLSRQPGSIRLYLLLISEHLARGEMEQAERLAEEASRKLPEYWEVWIARADVAMRRGRFDVAEHYLMTAAQTERNPTPRIARWMSRLDELRRSATQPSTRSVD